MSYLYITYITYERSSSSTRDSMDGKAWGIGESRSTHSQRRGQVDWDPNLHPLWTQQVLYISPTGPTNIVILYAVKQLGSITSRWQKVEFGELGTVVRNEHGTSRRSPKIWILILKAIVPPLTPESHTLFRLQYVLPKLDKIILLVFFFFLLNSSKGSWLWRKLYHTGPNGALSYLLSWPKMM